MANEGTSGQLLNWTSLELVMDPEPPNPSLIVEGKLPHPMKKVLLEPFPELLVEPEYWPTKVVGYSDGASDVITPYSVQVPLSELSMGTKGIELIGENQSENIDVPGI